MKPRTKCIFSINMSFTTKLMLSVIGLTLLVSLFISGISYQRAVDANEELEMVLTENSAENVQANFQTILDSTQNYITQIVHMESLRTVAERKEKFSEKELTVLSKQISSDIDNVLFYNSVSDTLTIEFVSIYLKNGYNYSSLPYVEYPFNDYVSCYDYLLKNDYIFEGSHIQATWYQTIEAKNASGISTRCCVGSRFLYDAVTMEKIGIIISGINEGDMCAMYSAGFPDAYIIQNTNTIISSNEKTQIGNKIKLDEDTLKTLRSNSSDHGTIYIESESNGGSTKALYYKLASYNIFLIVPLKNGNIIRSDVLSRFVIQSFFISIAAIVFGVLMAIFISRKLLNPVLSLKKVVQEVHNGNLSARFKPKNNDEIAYLGRQFNEMLQQIQQFINAQKQDALQKKDLEIRLLQSQMKPHLLYNALNSVALAIKLNDMEKAERLLYALSNFFRSSLSEGRDLVTLEEEINIVESYIIIQNLGRRQRIKIVENIQESLFSFKLLRLTLQPLIENAVLHGFFGYRDDGEIIISAKLVDNNTNIEICVTDNGIGIESDVLFEINQSINRKQLAKEQKYFGLFNINQRIKNYFGDKYGMTIYSEVGHYTQVAIKMPYSRTL